MKDKKQMVPKFSGVSKVLGRACSKDDATVSLTSSGRLVVKNIQTFLNDEGGFRPLFDPAYHSNNPIICRDFILIGITRVGSYEPGPRLPRRFRYFDMISASPDFLLLAG